MSRVGGRGEAVLQFMRREGRGAGLCGAERGQRGLVVLAQALAVDETLLDRVERVEAARLVRGSR